MKHLIGTLCVRASLCVLLCIACAPVAPEPKPPKGAVAWGEVPELAGDLVLAADEYSWIELDNETIVQAAAETHNALIVLIVSAMTQENRPCDAINFLRSHYQLDPLNCAQ